MENYEYPIELNWPLEISQDKKEMTSISTKMNQICSFIHKKLDIAIDKPETELFYISPKFQ